MLGLFCSGIVAVLAFVAHRQLPYRKMLVLTGVMLGFVLLVMVGEQAQEMQLAHWISTTPDRLVENPRLGRLVVLGFPNDGNAGRSGSRRLLVIGSYFLARRRTASMLPEPARG